LLRGRASEYVEAEIVTSDAGQEFGVATGAERRMLVRIEFRGFDGRPEWSPQWIHPGSFVENLRDVTAFLQDGHPQMIVFYGRRFATTITMQLGSLWTAGPFPTAGFLRTSRPHP